MGRQLSARIPPQNTPGYSASRTSPCHIGILETLAQDPFAPELKTHKLKGQLAGQWACWVARDCRIIFAFEPESAREEDMIVLVDIGSHDEVY